jgi:hypothetical protein
MDWNCYWYMLYSEHEGPRLIAYVEDFDEADLIVTEGAPKLLKAFAGRARRPSRFWQDIVNEWVAAHSKG